MWSTTAWGQHASDDDEHALTRYKTKGEVDHVFSLPFVKTRTNDERRVMVLRVENKCRMRDNLLEAAQDTATAVYNAVGVRLVWLPSRMGPTADLAGAPRFGVVLVAEANERPLLSSVSLPKAVLPSVLGITPLEARRVYLFCARITRAARLNSVTVDVLLGRVLAHEVGHLILPRMAHSDTGIMRSNVDMQRRESPGFTEYQGASIRTLLMASQ